MIRKSLAASAVVAVAASLKGHEVKKDDTVWYHQYPDVHDYPIQCMVLNGVVKEGTELVDGGHLATGEVPCDIVEVQLGYTGAEIWVSIQKLQSDSSLKAEDAAKETGCCRLVVSNECE